MARILVIEDDLLLAHFYENVFTLEGDEVELADGGEEGIRKAKEGKPDVILLDLVMPDMTGLSALERLKADQETLQIPVVVLTNVFDKEYAKKAKELGAVRYIVKSEYEPEEIYRMVGEVLQESETNTAGGVV